MKHPYKVPLSGTVFRMCAPPGFFRRARGLPPRADQLYSFSSKYEIG